MAGFDLAIYTVKFVIPSVFTILFWVFGLGYRDRRRLMVGLLVFVVYMTIVPPTLIIVMGYGRFTHVVSLVMTIGAMSILLFSINPPGKTILLILICAQMNSVVSVPLNMVRHLFGLSYLTLDIMLLVVCLVALRFWAKPLRFIADNMHGQLTTAMLIPIVATAMIYAIPVYPARNFEFHPVYCTVMMMAVEFSFFLYLYTLYRNMRQISGLSAHKLDAELLQVSATAILHRQTEPTLPRVKCYCKNYAVGAITSYYAALAEKRGIATNIQMDIPNELNIDSLEFAMALSNLFENAIHGCEELLGSGKKEIHVPMVATTIIERIDAKALVHKAWQLLQKNMMQNFSTVLKTECLVYVCWCKNKQPCEGRRSYVKTNK